MLKIAQRASISGTSGLFFPNRPLSRRLDRCDRVIHNESGDPNGGNMCSFSGATCTSRVRHNADYVPYAKIRFDQRVASLTLNCNGDFAIRAYW